MWATFEATHRSGWLLSRRAVKELGVAALQADHGPFAEADLVDACPDEAEIRPLAEALATKKAEAKAAKKKAKREKKRGRDGGGAEPEEEAPAAPKPPPKKKTASVALGAAASVAKAAREKIAKDHGAAHIGEMFHDEKDKSTTGAADLFIATAPRRYNLN